LNWRNGARLTKLGSGFSSLPISLEMTEPIVGYWMAPCGR